MSITNTIVEKVVIAYKYTYNNRMIISGYCNDKDTNFYMLVMSFECIMIWLFQITKNYNYLWIIEQDLSYSGNFFNLFQKYDNK